MYLSILAPVLTIGLISTLLQVYLFWRYYLSFAPLQAPSQAYTPLDSYLAQLIHLSAYLLAPGRWPFTLLPWIGKRCFFLLFNKSAYQMWHSLPLQLARLLGEALNLSLTSSILIYWASSAPSRVIAFFASYLISTELLRLSAQKGQMVMSGVWQQIPHRRIAALLQAWGFKQSFVQTYCHYYLASDEERLSLITAYLKQIAPSSPIARRRLRHFHGFQIVPDSHQLRSGHVRDVANGLVFVHRAWSNDPHLLIGQALRRSPWIFDPRELARPFRYRTQANCLMCAFVLQHMAWCAPYAYYQFGHEIKAAGHDLWLRLVWVLSFDQEDKVDSQGVFHFNERPASVEQLWSESELFQALSERLKHGETLIAEQIAQEYTFPLLYIKEVVLPQLAHQQPIHYAISCPEITLATRSGASQ